MNPADLPKIVTPGLFAKHASRGRWHMARHLAHLDRVIVQTLRDGDGRLIINMPPRHGKSMYCSEHLPAWYLGKNPDHEILLGSYESDFAATWGRKARRLMEEYGPPLFNVRVSRDSSAANRWGIDGRAGGMQTAGVGGAFTGKGAHLLIIEDPIKGYKEAHSETIRDNIWNWYLSDAHTRLAPHATIIVIQTRWHEDDLTGRLLRDMAAGGEHWRVVNLPCLAEDGDELGRKPGEVLWPERYDAAWAAKECRTQGGPDGYNWCALFQQRPMPEGGGMFKREWFEIIDEVPRNLDRVVRYWDCAGTQDGGDATAGVLMGARRDPFSPSAPPVSDPYSSRRKDYETDEGYEERRKEEMRAVGGFDEFFVLDCRAGNWDAANRNRVVKQTMDMDEHFFGNRLTTWFEQEPARSGKEVAEQEVRRYAGHNVRVDPVTDSKKLRARPWAAILGVRAVKLVNGPWVPAYIDEHCVFPNGKHDDRVDASDGAFSKIAVPRMRFELASSR